MAVANNLAYYITAAIMASKSFIALAIDVSKSLMTLFQ
jgi:hypothetical protein